MSKLSIAVMSLAILCLGLRLSFADSYTVNVPNNQGGYTAVVINQSGSGYVGPQGEYYSSFPSVYQLQTMYANGVSATAIVTNTVDEPTVTVVVAPPELPEYVQPPQPQQGYIWTPGYWRYDSFSEDYYWVPGTWIEPPQPHLLWTPGYWYWQDGFYVYHEGYWSEHVGFYGGIDYGYGYGGHGYSGGYWNNNTYITINVTEGIHQHTSFNGGNGGVQAQPTTEEQTVTHEHHWQPTSQQTLQVQTASQNQTLRASFNHGKPAIAATSKPGVFQGAGVVHAKKAGAYYKESKPIVAVHAPSTPTPINVHPSYNQPATTRTQFTGQQRQPSNAMYQNRPEQWHPVEERKPLENNRPEAKSEVKSTQKPAPVHKPRPKPEEKPSDHVSVSTANPGSNVEVH